MSSTYQTSRLFLRPLRSEDAQAIYAYRANKDNFPFVDMPEYTSLDQAHEYIDKMQAGMAEDKWYVFAIETLDSNEFIGTLSLWNFNEGRTQAEFGYGLFPEFRGRGYMQEALAWALDFASKTLNLQVVEAWTPVDNAPSLQLLNRLNFVILRTEEEEAMTGSLISMAVLAYKF